MFLVSCIVNLYRPAMRFLGLGDLIKIFIKRFFTNLETYDYVFFFKNLGERLEANVSLGFVQDRL